MKFNVTHDWNLSPSEAIKLQKELRRKIVLKNNFKKVRFIAGCDMAVNASGQGCAAVLIYSWPDLQFLEHQTAVMPLKFPYVPGLLSFREIPVLAAAFAKLRIEPDLIFFDGQGIAHPRGLGIGAHMGLLLKKPSIGCAKSRLFGLYAEPGIEKGSRGDLNDKEGNVIGTVLRSKRGCNPLFISPGYGIDCETAVEFVMLALDGFRVPKPTREADAYAGKLARNAGKPRRAD